MAENPQDTGPAAGNALLVEPQPSAELDGAETMQETVTQTESLQSNETAPASGQGKKRRARMLDVRDVRAEMSKRGKVAATENYMSLGTEGALSISDLQRKHGLAHSTQVTRAIKKMACNAEHFALAREHLHSERVQQEIGVENPAASQAAEVAGEQLQQALRCLQRRDDACSNSVSGQGHGIRKGSGQGSEKVRHSTVRSCFEEACAAAWSGSSQQSWACIQARLQCRGAAR